MVNTSKQNKQVSSMIQFFSDVSLCQKNFLQVLNRVQPSVYSDNF